MLEERKQRVENRQSIPQILETEPREAGREFTFDSTHLFHVRVRHFESEDPTNHISKLSKILSLLSIKRGKTLNSRYTPQHALPDQLTHSIKGRKAHDEDQELVSFSVLSDPSKVGVIGTHQHNPARSLLREIKFTNLNSESLKLYLTGEFDSVLQEGETGKQYQSFSKEFSTGSHIPQLHNRSNTMYRKGLATQRECFIASEDWYSRFSGTR